MPNLNAALGCAQMERLEEFLNIKIEIAKKWDSFFKDKNIKFFKATEGNKANHWLNTIVFDSNTDRNNFLLFSNERDVMTRPIWTLMSKLPMYINCQNDGLKNSLWLEKRVVNIPSSVPDGALK
jgi:perosamine synthetase